MPRLQRGGAPTPYAAADGAPQGGLLEVLAVVAAAADLLPRRHPAGGRLRGGQAPTARPLRRCTPASIFVPPAASGGGGSGGASPRPDLATASGHVDRNGPPLGVCPGGVTRLQWAALPDGRTRPWGWRR